MRFSRGRILRDASRVLTLAIAAPWCAPPAAGADGPSPASAARAALPAGTLTVAVVTTPADPASKALFQALRATPWAVANARSFRFVEIAANPGGGPGSPAPSEVHVYRQGARGPEMIGGRSGFAGAGDLVGWLRTLEPRPAAAAEAPAVDAGVVQARFHHDAPAASEQGYCPPAPAPQPQYQQPASVPASVPTPSMVPQSTTTYAVPMAPASVVQAPAQNVLIQQPPTQVFFATQASTAGFVPQASMPASVPAGNLFMPAGPAMAPASVPAAAPMMMAPASAPMMMAPAASPMMMTAAAPMMMAPAAAPAAMAPAAMAPAATMAVAASGPAVAGAALTTSSFSVPASSTSSRVRVRGPGPLASAAARFGERLTTLGRTRIETVQETRLETQTAQTPPGQFMTLSSTAASPVMAPQQNVSVPASVPQQPTCQQPTCPPPSGPQPSPQGEPETSGHRLFRGH